jgi:integrase
VFEDVRRYQLHLTSRGVDSKRMVIRVEQGKERKDRYVMLCAHLLALLRTWWLVLRPRGYLFPGQDRISPLTQRRVRRLALGPQASPASPSGYRRTA